MKIHIDQQKCQGHGRCYGLAPELIEADDVGNGHEIGDGDVRPELQDQARLAVANCPEQAVTLEEA